MKIIFDDIFLNSDYALDPAAEKGRLDSILKMIKDNLNDYEIIKPESAKEEDILRAHTKKHLNYYKKNPLLYKLASFSVGGVIKAAEEAFNNNPSFAVIRPPGHHASSDSCWGFCYFNNIAIALLKLFFEKKIKSAFILDFDFHFGDGTVTILKKEKKFRTKILNPNSNDKDMYLFEIKEYLNKLDNIDIIAVSAGFDLGIEDWGGLLFPKDYNKIGKLLKKFSNKISNGRRFAVLEGGYNPEVLGVNFNSFCQGFK